MSIFPDIIDAFSHDERNGKSHEQHPKTISYFPKDSTGEESEFLNDELRMVDQPLDGFE